MTRAARGAVIVLTLGALLAVMVVVLVVLKTDDDLANAGPLEVRAACQEFAEGRLDITGTAEFSNWTEFFDEGRAWIVSGVISQNVSGERKRSNITCRMHSDGDRWVLDRLSQY